MTQVGFIVTFSFSRQEDQGTVNKIVKNLRHAYYVAETTLSDRGDNDTDKKYMQSRLLMFSI